MTNTRSLSRGPSSFTPPHRSVPSVELGPADSPLDNRINIDGGSSHHGVKADSLEPSPWIRNYASNALLEHYEIMHMGVVSADQKYRVSRANSPYTHFIACLSGEASLWLEGAVHRLLPGNACLLPTGVSHMDQTSGHGPWQFCYVCYQHRGKDTGFHGLSDALVSKCNPLPLLHTIEALRHECSEGSDTECQRQLLSVIHHIVLRFAEQIHAPQEAFRHLWQRVAATPAEAWPLERLEHEAHCHREHLRRLCHRYFGHSPVQQVAFLRMQHAATLLTTTAWTLDRIASEVGYADAFSFSTAFKHCFKSSPGHFRQHAHGQAGGGGNRA